MDRVLDKYKLYFEWAGIHYEQGTASFLEAWFSGPVIKDAQVQSDTYIDLDFTAQNIGTGLFLPENFFVARLSWKEIEYKDDKILLRECRLSHNVGGSLKNLEEGFRFLIDCSKHEERTHAKFLVYSAWVVKPSNDIIQ